MGIGQLAQRLGLSVHTLRFWEREGLLPEIRRGPGGRRVYTDEDAEWLTLCLNLRATGMPIPILREYTALARTGATGDRERLDLLRQHQLRVQVQIDTLRHALYLIQRKIAIHESGARDTDCQLARLPLQQSRPISTPPRGGVPR
jgi:DNA-binding transcriptional MerR regulator